MSELISHAERELARIGGDEMQEEMNNHILGMVRLFSEEGHSGMSAAYAVGILEKLLRFEPLGPLTGEDSEWIEVGEQKGALYQNNRCSRVFKADDGAYDIDGKVFFDECGISYTNIDSRVPVTFPYTPKTEYVDERKAK